MKTTKELIIEDITAKVEAKLASQKVELANIAELNKIRESAKKNLAEFRKHQTDLKAIAKLAISSGEKFQKDIFAINDMANDLNTQFKVLGLNYLENADVKAAISLLNQNFDVADYVGYAKQVD